METAPFLFQGLDPALEKNATLKILFFEMCKDLKFVDSILPWYSPETPKPMYESPDEQAYWDFPVYADHTCVKANRVGARLVDYKGKKVWVVYVAEGRSIEAIHRLYIYI